MLISVAGRPGYGLVEVRGCREPMRIAAMDLRTTTRPNRNIDLFRTARTLLSAGDRERPIAIIEVGPGLAVKHLGRLADQKYPLWDFVRRIESGIRRIPMPDGCYESYETRELCASLSGLQIRVTILDINPRVVRIVKAINADLPIEPVVADLGAEVPTGFSAFVGRYDLVVANAVLVRIPVSRRETARRNLLSLAAPHGLVLTEVDDCPAGFERVAGAPRFLRRLA